MSEKQFIWKCDDENCQIYDTKKKKAYFNVEVVDLLNEQQSTIQSLQREIEELGISITLFEDDIATKDKKIGEQQVIIDRLQKYNDVLHDENFFNTMKMFEFMKEKGVFDEFYERIKKEVLNDG